MTNEELLQKIYSGYKTLVAYYPYPARGFGGTIVETDPHNGGQYDEPLKNFINLCVQLGASVAGRRLENKSAVKMEVEGLDFPVYLRRFDGYYMICKDAPLPGRLRELPINWKIEH